MSRRELGAAAACGLAAAALVALLTLVGGAGLLWSDEWVYATAARELAAGRPPLAFGITAFHVDRFGFPYEEYHARGGIAAMALAFRALGAHEVVALVPAWIATVLAALVAHAAARSAGLAPAPAAAAGALVAALPTVAGFAATGFVEAPITLALLLGAASVGATGTRARIALAVLATVLGVAWRETALVVPFAVAVGLAARAWSDGLTVRAALAAAVPGALAALVAGTGAWRLASAGIAGSSGRGFLAWYVAMPLAGAEASRDGYSALGTAVPEITWQLVAARAVRMLPEVFFRPSDSVEGALVGLVLVHGLALLALAGLARRCAPAVRGIAAYALALYVTKVVFLVFIYEPPGFNARHLAGESAPLLLAVALAAGSFAPRRALVALAALAGLAFVADDIHIARCRAERRGQLTGYSSALGRVAATPPGRVLVASNAWPLAWSRPGLFVALPPATERGLALFAERVPADTLVLHAREPLVARHLVAEGAVPQRLGDFELAARDVSLGVTLLRYERRRR